MIPIHKNGDPKRPKGQRRVCSRPQLTTSELLADSMLQQRDQREMRAIGKATEAAREASEGLPI